MIGLFGLVSSWNGVRFESLSVRLLVRLGVMLILVLLLMLLLLIFVGVLVVIGNSVIGEWIEFFVFV